METKLTSLISDAAHLEILSPGRWSPDSSQAREEVFFRSPITIEMDGGDYSESYEADEFYLPECGEELRFAGANCEGIVAHLIAEAYLADGQVRLTFELTIA